jgi:hypothetical protein
MVRALRGVLTTAGQNVSPPLMEKVGATLLQALASEDQVLFILTSMNVS